MHNDLQPLTGHDWFKLSQFAMRGVLPRTIGLTATELASVSLEDDVQRAAEEIRSRRSPIMRLFAQPGRIQVNSDMIRRVALDRQGVLDRIENEGRLYQALSALDASVQDAKNEVALPAREKRILPVPSPRSPIQMLELAGREKLGAPPEAMATSARADKLGVDHVIWKNFGGAVATTSSQAASVRDYFGIKGIPLSYELSSHLYSYEQAGEKRFVMILCRASDTLDTERVGEFLGGVTLQKADGPRDFGHEIAGRVSPFMPETESANIRILFDEHLAPGRSETLGLWTNAGEPTWSIMFKPENHPAYTPGNTGCFIDPESYRPYEHPLKVGIVAGNPFAAGVAFKELLESGVNIELSMEENARKAEIDRAQGREPEARKATSRFTSQHRMASLAKIIEPDVLLDSTASHDISMRFPQAINLTRDNLLRRVEKLCRNGIEMLAIPDNTLSFFASDVREMCSRYGVSYVSLPEALEQHLKQNPPKGPLALFTMPGLTDPANSPYRNILNGQYEICPMDLATLVKCSEIAEDIKAAQGATDKHAAMVFEMIKKFMDKNPTAQPVLLLSELSLASRLRPHAAVLDPLAICAQQMASLYRKLSKTAIPSQETADRSVLRHAPCLAGIEP